MRRPVRRARTVIVRDGRREARRSRWPAVAGGVGLMLGGVVSVSASLPVVATTADVGALEASALSTAGSPATLAAGSEHSCALLGDGTVRCWGADYAGQPGTGPRRTRRFRRRFRWPG